MTERERLIKLIHMGIEYARGQMNDEGVDFAYGDVADHLHSNGVIVPLGHNDPVGERGECGLKAQCSKEIKAEAVKEFCKRREIEYVEDDV